MIVEYAGGLRERSGAGTLKVRMRKATSPPAVALAVVVFSLLAAASTWTAIDSTTADDRNGDGRPDMWRTYDRAGRLIELAFDSNFDGRSDVHEYYTGGDLVRRESDRNFDDRVDLVEEFDRATHEPVRATIDIDFDGIADVLTLFQDGQPVYSVQASVRRAGLIEDRSIEAPRRGQGDSPLAALQDPFASDAAVRSQQLAAVAIDAASTIPAVFQCARPVDVHATVHARCWPLATGRLCGRATVARTPRGPPRPVALADHLAA